MAKKKQSSGAGCAVLLAVLLVGGVWSGISHLVNGGDPQPTTSDYYSTVVPTDDYAPDTYDDPYAPVDTYAPDTYDPDTDIPDTAVDPGGTDSSGGSGGYDLPGHGYVDGPGVHCSLHGCGVDVLPHFGWHF